MWKNYFVDQVPLGFFSSLPMHYLKITILHHTIQKQSYPPPLIASLMTDVPLPFWMKKVIGDRHTQCIWQPWQINHSITVPTMASRSVVFNTKTHNLVGILDYVEIRNWFSPTISKTFLRSLHPSGRWEHPPPHIFLEHKSWCINGIQR